MRGFIIAGLAIFYFTAGCLAPASAFSLFSDKKEKQEESIEAKVEETVKPIEKKPKPVVVFNPDNPLGVTYAEDVINKAAFYLEEGDLRSAQETINPIKDWIYKATEYHTDLYKTLKNLNNAEVQADVERDLAVKFAILRDKALFLQSKILITNGQKKEAIEKLVEVVRSQPSTDLGYQAYELLKEVGFTYKVEFQANGSEGN